MTELLYQGHGSFRIVTNDGTVLYVDPYAGDGYDLPADLILVSHEHYDHTAIDKMPHNPGCVIYRASDLLNNGIYQSLSEKDITVHAVQACNKNHPLQECVGFVLEIDGLTIYASGDTSETEDMHNRLPQMKLDYALLCGDGVYNMDIEEASRCGRIIGARHTIPIHLKPGALFSEEAAEAFSTPGKMIVRPGERVPL